MAFTRDNQSRNRETFVSGSTVDRQTDRQTRSSRLPNTVISSAFLARAYKRYLEDVWGMSIFATQALKPVKVFPSAMGNRTRPRAFCHRRSLNPCPLIALCATVSSLRLLASSLSLSNWQGFVRGLSCLPVASFPTWGEGVYSDVSPAPAVIYSPRCPPFT